MCEIHPPSLPFPLFLSHNSIFCPHLNPSLLCGVCEPISFLVSQTLLHTQNTHTHTQGNHLLIPFDVLLAQEPILVSGIGP